MPANCETGTRSPELTGWALSVTSYEFRIIFPRMYVFVGIKMYVSSWCFNLFENAERFISVYPLTWTSDVFIF